MRSHGKLVSAAIVMLLVTFAVAAPDSKPTAPANDPYVDASPLVTQAPTERVPCSIYSSTCYQEGRRCGPQGAKCYCSFHSSTGWICGGALP
ncbi:MAG: hypothetical protein ACREAA_02995 [Candidatus Polarisedimenticolia bacterium]